MQKSKSKLNKLSRFLTFELSYFRAFLLSSSLALSPSRSLAFSLSSFLKRERGLSLIELMAAISIFTATVAVTMAIFLNIVTSQKRSQNSINVESTAYFVMETIAREIRTGYTFSCDIIDGGSSDCNKIKFTNYHGDVVSYYVNNGKIYKNCITDNLPTGDCPFGDISPSTLEVSYLRFVLEGVVKLDGKQPKITIVLEMKTPASVPTAQARDIKLQTTISSRQSDT